MDNQEVEDTEVTSVQITKGGLRKLGKVAEANRRSKTAQIEWMIELEMRRLARLEAQHVAITEAGRNALHTEAPND